MVVCLLILSGCSATETMETIGDSYDQLVIAPQMVKFAVPNDASSQVISGDSGTIYFCEGYEIVVQTMSGGNLDSTLRSVTGYPKDALTVVETSDAYADRYECVWIAAGEGGDQVGRTAILDDGNYHYCLSVMAPAQEAGSLQEVWQSLFLSLELQS